MNTRNETYQDRREFKRKEWTSPVDDFFIKQIEPEISRGTTKNISGGGVCTHVNNPIHIGFHLSLRIGHPGIHLYLLRQRKSSGVKKLRQPKQ